MNDFINSNPNNLDDYLKNMLGNYKPDVSSNLWSSLKLKLFKKDVLDFVSFKKLNHTLRSPAKFGAAHIKVLVGYAIAACFTVALVFGSNYIYKNYISNNKNKEKEEIKEKPAVPSVKSEQIIIDSSPANTVQQNATLVHQTPKQQKNQETQLVNDTVTRVASPVVKNTIDAVNSNDNKTENINSYNTLLKYIDRVNSNEKNPVEETQTEELPDNIDITIDDPESPQPENTGAFAYNLEIPNVITPNGDGYNDYFLIKNLDKYPYNSLTIANRKGAIVFETTGYQNNWDARNLESGTYYYILTYKDNNNKNQGVIKGVISVVR